MSTVPSLIKPSDGMALSSVPVTSELFNSRILVLDEEVSPASCSALVQQLLVLEHEDSEAEVTLLISSPGGDVHAGLGLIDVMGDVSCPIRTVGLGCVASMASVILACGSRRAVYPHTHVLIHQLKSGVGYAQQTDIDIVAAQSAALRAELDRLLAEHSAVSVEKIHNLTERDCWLTAEQALELGIIDEIVGS